MKKFSFPKYLRTACLSLDLRVPATHSLPLYAMLSESFRLELSRDMTTVVSLWKSLGVGSFLLSLFCSKVDVVLNDLRVLHTTHEGVVRTT